MPRWLNAANLLTLLRLALTPFVIQAIVAGRHVLALALFSIAAFTDALDGAAARRFHLATAAGAYLDPIADKVLMSGVFLALAIGHIVPWWLVGWIFGARHLYSCGRVLVFDLHQTPQFSAQQSGQALHVRTNCHSGDMDGSKRARYSVTACTGPRHAVALRGHHRLERPRLHAPRDPVDEGVAACARMKLVPLVPPYIESLRPYEAGARSVGAQQYGLWHVAKLASNENPLGPRPRRSKR